MVKSRYFTFIMIFLFLLTIFMLVNIIAGFTSYFFNLNFLGYEKNSDSDNMFRMLFGISFVLLFSFALSFKVKIITIDSRNKTISLKNILTRKLVIYSFSELDGYCDMIVKHGKGGESYKTIGLVKGKILIFKIDSFYYSNVNQMREALQGLKYLGIDID